MTKEVLKLKFGQGKLTYEELVKFFESNVCIPKGENRHPDADVLHEWVEDITKELQYSEHDYNNWYRSSLMNVPDYVKLRIKPSELAYEWQWVKEKYGLEIARSSFFTEYEAKQYLNSYWLKIEETKRIRQ